MFSGVFVLEWLHDFRDVLLSVDWALLVFFLVKLTPFEFVSKNILQNIGGILLFAVFVIGFEMKGKDLLWTLIGKHHRIFEQVVILLAILIGLAGLFTLVAG